MRSGFRAIDTACQPKHYHQPGVGEALSTLIREDGLKREELFIQTKYTSPDGQDLSKPLPYDRSAPLTQQASPHKRVLTRELMLKSFNQHCPGPAIFSNFVEGTSDRLHRLAPPAFAGAYGLKER